MPDQSANDQRRYTCHYKNRTFFGDTQEEALQKMADYMNSEKGTPDAAPEKTATKTAQGRTL